MRLITRAEWGARSPKRVNKGVLSAESTCHWNGPTVTVGGSSTWDHSKCASLVRGIQNFHMDSKGWLDIAYNFIECPHGYTFVGRGINVINGANGTNSGNQSSHAIMCLAGDGNSFFDAEKAEFRACVRYVADNSLAPDKCRGHRDWKATACPGEIRYAWVHQGMPLSGTAPTPAPIPTPAPTPPVETERDRIKWLQGLVSASTDGIWGPNTEAAIRRNYIGWNKDLAGNRNRNLVRHLQHQGNRKFNNGMAEDGLIGPATNHLIVVQLSQSDGIAGPNAWRLAVK